MKKYKNKPTPEEYEAANAFTELLAHPCWKYYEKLVQNLIDRQTKVTSKGLYRKDQMEYNYVCGQINALEYMKEEPYRIIKKVEESKRLD